MAIPPRPCANTLASWLCCCGPSSLGHTVRDNLPFCPFSPRISVPMQRDAFDAKSITALLEFRGAVARADAPQIGKQRAAARQVPQDFRHVLVKAHDGNRVRFHPV